MEFFTIKIIKRTEAFVIFRRTSESALGPRISPRPQYAYINISSNSLSILFNHLFFVEYAIYPGLKSCIFCIARQIVGIGLIDIQILHDMAWPISVDSTLDNLLGGDIFKDLTIYFSSSLCQYLTWQEFTLAFLR